MTLVKKIFKIFIFHKCNVATTTTNDVTHDVATSAAYESVTGSSDVPREVFQISIKAGGLVAARRHVRAAQFHDGRHVARRQSFVDRRCPDVIDDVTGCHGSRLLAAEGQVYVAKLTKVPHDVTSRSLVTSLCSWVV